MEIVENVVIFSVIVGAGAALIWYDPRLFALYAFAMTVGLIIFVLSRLWKLIAVFEWSTTVKILTLAKIMGATEADFHEVMKEEDKRLSPAERKAFERYIRTL
jgi:hypothetical protein